jgi:hypothetical protein
MWRAGSTSLHFRAKWGTRGNSRNVTQQWVYISAKPPWDVTVHFVIYGAVGTRFGINYGPATERIHFTAGGSRTRAVLPTSVAET